MPDDTAVEVKVKGEIENNPLAGIQEAIVKVLDEFSDKEPGLGWAVILALPTPEGHVLTWTSAILSKHFVKKVMDDYEAESAVDISGLIN